MSRYCLTIGLFLGLLARFVSPLAAADAPPVHDPSDVPSVAPAVRQAMQDRDYAAARKAIDEAAKDKDAPNDYLAYLRAWSFHLDKQYDQAIAALEKFANDYPQSAWLRRAGFAKAQAMAAKGDFRGAQAIYESEAKYLLSDQRRQQSAEIYQEFGDALFQPPAGHEPEYKGARQVYATALDAGLKGPRRADVEYRVCICLEKLGLRDEAAKSFKDFLAAHADDPRQNEVRYRLGNCLLAAGKPADARKVWKELISGVPSHPLARQAQVGEKPHDWPAEAAYRLAETWRCPQPGDDDGLRHGVAALHDFISRYPGHELAGEAHLQIALSQIHLGHLDDAIATLKDFLRDPLWKDRKELPDALRMLGNVYLRQEKYAEALTAWRDYLARYSTHEDWSSVQQSVIDAEYAVGLEKFHLNQFDAAEQLLTEFMAHYPLDARNPGILFLFGEIQQRQKKWDAAIAAWQKLAAKYPHSAEAGRAETMIARTLDEPLGRYQEARERYRKAGDTAALAAISARRMQLETERVFRSDETPQLKLATRNVSAVKVRVYKIDLETYFRKMHSVAGIERLDVSLIDPDATFEFAVPGFAKYRPLTSSIPVPLPDGLKAGVTAVTVTSPTQEATSLVIQSDLQIVLRSSRDELLVFAQNVRTGKPWPGVRLLLSDGKSVFAEAKTGDDGFFAHRYAGLQDTACLRVFAVADGGHVASTAVQLAGEGESVKLADRIFVDTDRAAYHAGEPVHVRGCARHAQDDRMVTEAGKKLSVELHDQADRRLRRQNVTLSALGTFFCDFPLPAGMPEGSYAIVVSDDAGHHRTAQFEIGPPPAETARLTIDLPRSVYYRGQTIEGVFRVVLPHDRPLADAKVEYCLGEQPTATVTTDARGEARFAIATDDWEGQNTSVLTASVAARDISRQSPITIATRSFSLVLSTARPVYVAGESFDVQVKTTDAAGEPTAQKLLVKVSRQQKLGDVTRDEPIEEHAITTAADGTAKFVLKPSKGGLHTILASGTDRFGNSIERRLEVRASDDDDQQQLLLLPDRTELKAGDTADVQIYWRGQPATAVVTTHYDRLREHRLVALQKGANHLQLPVTAAMAPGFTLAVAVMDQASPSLQEKAGKLSPFHVAECEFSVDPRIQVRIECHRRGDAAAKPRPGEPIDVSVTTCDAQGKPVAAEVSLAVLPSDRIPAEAAQRETLPRFFMGRGHTAEFETASSIQFHYRPLHRVIAPDLSDADASAASTRVRPAILASVGANGAKPQHKQVLRAASKAPAADAAGDDPFGDAPAAPQAAKGDVMKKPVKSDDADPFAEVESPAAKAPASAQSKAGPHLSDAVDATGLSRPSWPCYWNPSVATGPDGRATISFTPPDDAANLTLAARAIAADNLTGQVAQEVVLKKDLAAEIQLPPAFTDGDEIEIPVVVQNNVLGQGTIEVELSLDVDGAKWSDKKTLPVTVHGRLETSFKPLVRQVQRPATDDGWLPSRPEAVFTVTVKAGGQTDVVRRSVPIRPYGEDYQVTAAGLVAANATLVIAPSRHHWVAPRLQLAVSPNIQRSLLDLFDPPADERDGPIAVTGAEGLPAASDLMAACALAKLYPPQSAGGCLLDERIRGALGLLIATQQRDGGWSNCGRPCTLPANAVAYWSLVLAGKAGYDVPHEVLVAGLANLRGGLAANQEGDLAAKAIVLHALAVSGQGDFSLANQLLRDRKSLSPLGRAYLALALVRMDRKDSAADVLKPSETAETPPQAAATDAEAQAVAALALLGLDPASPQAKTLIYAVLGQRQGLRWNPENATGPAVLAAVEWLPRNRPADGTLTINVNGKALKALEPSGRTQIVEVPTFRLVKGKQSIEFHTLGRDQVAVYRCTLSGVDPAESVAGSSSAWHIERSYEPPLMEVDDQAIPRGFSALGGDLWTATFKNRLTQLPAARRGFVELTAYCVGTEKTADDPSGLDSAGGPELMIVEPLPSGATVVESSLAGTFERAEILPGRIVFHLKRRAPNLTIRYELEGVFPGANLVSPTLLCRVGRDRPLAVTKPKSLVVLPQGAHRSDPYRLSPDELLALGATAKRKGDVAAATRYYTELLESWHGRRGFGLSESAYKQTVVALMQLGMGRAAPAKLVQYCEIVKEKWPDEPVTLEQLLTAAGAYREIGETERSYMACRAAVEGSFTLESGAAGFLDSQGEFLRSVTRMNQLLRDYPPEPYLAEAEFDLAQRVYAKGSEVQMGSSQPKLDREVLIARAGQMLESFLTGYPHDTAADQAAFAAANAQLELKHYAQAAELAAAYARRYPNSDLLDSYWYLLAYCDFAMGQYPAAIDMCRKVAQAQHLDKETGRMVDSQNKNRAIYILGQIYQSLGQRADAIREYRRVEDHVPDAKSSIAYFVRKEISLPECTTLKPGTAAEVELRYRNIARCDVKVYRVDLLKFCEAGQALGDIAQVNLSGIRPLDQGAVALAASGDYADHVQKLSLPLKNQGAYLVVCRGEDLYASGLLLISPLEIEHRFDPSSGQVRVFVKDATTGKCASEVQVKLLPRGPNVTANLAGSTDLRGVFVTNCPATGVTIVAQAGPGQYAYVASPAVSNEPHGGVAQSRLPEIDPTAPFGPFASSAERPVAAEERPPVVQGQASQPAARRSPATSPRPAAPAVAGAEQPLPPRGPNAPAGLAGDESPAERRIRAALDSPTAIEFVETPLKDVVDYLKDIHHIEIQLDTAGLKDAGIDESTPVTKNLNGISLRSALRLMLDELQLKYVIHNDVLLITSPQKAESDEFMTTKAYPVTDLVEIGTGGTVDFEVLKELISNTVAQKSWLDNGGTGTISDIIVGNRALLVLSQTQEVHEEIVDLLDTLRKAGGLKAGARKLAEAEQGEDEADLPARPAARLHHPAPPAGQGFGGMGGMGGGMGGMAGGGQAPFVISTIPVSDGQSGDADLLGGLKNANSANQQSKVRRLKQRQDAGQNSGAMGGMGGGGMGAGFF